VLQGWSQIGWKGSAAQRVFLYRDRKILFGYLAVAIGYVSIALAAAAGVAAGTWADVVPSGPWGDAVVDAFTTLTITFLSVRAAFIAAVYGWAQAAWSPVRFIWASFINLAAAARAIRVVSTRAQPRWDKTAHEFPDVIA
jgi:adsorption protein B